MHITTYESSIYKAALSDFMSRIRTTVTGSYQKSVRLFRVSFFFFVFVLLERSNIWDSICLVFPLSAKNKASYVGKHWVENWLYSRSHGKKKKDAHFCYRLGYVEYLVSLLPEELKFNC